MEPKVTQGNFVVLGLDGERIAAFATESDKVVFESAKEGISILRDLMDSLSDCGDDRLYKSALLYDDCRAVYEFLVRNGYPEYQAILDQDRDFSSSLNNSDHE